MNIKDLIKAAWLEPFPWFLAGSQGPVCLGCIGTNHVRVTCTLLLAAVRVNGGEPLSPAQTMDVVELLAESRSEPVGGDKVVVYWPRIEWTEG